MSREQCQQNYHSPDMTDVSAQGTISKSIVIPLLARDWHCVFLLFIELESFKKLQKTNYKTWHFTCDVPTIPQTGPMYQLKRLQARSKSIAIPLLARDWHPLFLFFIELVVNTKSKKNEISVNHYVWYKSVRKPYPNHTPQTRTSACKLVSL